MPPRGGRSRSASAPGPRGKAGGRAGFGAAPPRSRGMRPALRRTAPTPPPSCLPPDRAAVRLGHPRRRRSRGRNPAPSGTGCRKRSSGRRAGPAFRPGRRASGADPELDPRPAAGGSRRLRAVGPAAARAESPPPRRAPRGAPSRCGDPRRGPAPRLPKNGGSRPPSSLSRWSGARPPRGGAARRAVSGGPDTLRRRGGPAGSPSAGRGWGFVRARRLTRRPRQRRRLRQSRRPLRTAARSPGRCAARVGTPRESEAREGAPGAARGAAPIRAPDRTRAPPPAAPPRLPGRPACGRSRPAGRAGSRAAAAATDSWFVALVGAKHADSSPRLPSESGPSAEQQKRRVREPPIVGTPLRQAVVCEQLGFREHPALFR